MRVDSQLNEIQTEAGPFAGPRYSVVVPVYHEQENIGRLCRQLLDQLPPDYEVLLCYDEDNDPTLPALAAVPEESKPKPIRLIRNRLGRGPNFAIEAGMRAARAPVVFVVMADLSDDLSKMEEMTARVEAGADIVCGSRYMQGGQQIGGPWLKGLLSKAAGLSLHWLTGLSTRDPTNSFKAYRRAFLDGVSIESTAGFCLALELTVKAHLRGGRVAEVPSTWTDREAGQSTFKLWAWLPKYLYWYLYAIAASWIPAPWRVAQPNVPAPHRIRRSTGVHS